MNPHRGQYALGGTLSGWSRVDRPTRRQQRALRSAYLGLNPRVYSRYGRRQWASPLPWTRLIVKDPFAMLSMPVVQRTVGARIILTYRHPGALLASYRRMGWTPDLAELTPVVRDFRRQMGSSVDLPDPPRPGEANQAEEMSWFWNALYTMALADLAMTRDALVISHSELVSGGRHATQELYAALGLEWRTRAVDAQTRLTRALSSRRRLHNFDREPAEVANSWRDSVTSDELRTIGEMTAAVSADLEQRRLCLR
jgi:hypothetical protein